MKTQKVNQFLRKKRILERECVNNHILSNRDMKNYRGYLSNNFDSHKGIVMVEYCDQDVLQEVGHFLDLYYLWGSESVGRKEKMAKDFGFLTELALDYCLGEEKISSRCERNLEVLDKTKSQMTNGR